LRNTEIDSVYKLLVRKYAYNFPKDPLEKLNGDILLLMNKGKSRERAVLELALNCGLVYRFELEAMVKNGKPKEEAITTLLKGQKLHLTEDDEEVKKIVDSAFRDVVYRPAVTSEGRKEPTRMWYLVPIVFSLLGGVIAYVGVKGDDRNMADNLLILGFLVFALQIILIWWTIWRVL
jgi:hypothetical protein